MGGLFTQGSTSIKEKSMASLGDRIGILPTASSATDYNRNANARRGEVSNHLGRPYPLRTRMEPQEASFPTRHASLQIYLVEYRPSRFEDVGYLSMHPSRSFVVSYPQRRFTYFITRQMPLHPRSPHKLCKPVRAISQWLNLVI